MSSSATDEKLKYIKLAALIAIAGNAVLAVGNIIAGALAHSGALIGAGIDSSTDVLISIITLLVVKIISKPADANHPWGHGRAEPIATVLLSFVIFFAGAQLIVSSISALISGEVNSSPGVLALVVSGISIVSKLFLALCQNILGKKAQSELVKANAKNMASDVVISVGVFLGLLLTNLTGHAFIDGIIAIVVGLWIIKTAVGIFMQVNLELMDGNNNKDAYKIIMDAVNSVDGASNPHRARMRSISGFWDIDLDIEVDPNITVHEAHQITQNVEVEIKNKLDNVFDVVIHVEPSGDNSDEAYGLSEKEINKETKD